MSGKWKEKLGLVHIYTGNGKGKTTAAFGLALRMLGSGGKVIIIQFMKAPNVYGEQIKGEECGIKIGTSFEIVPGDILKVYQQVSPESISNS